jgi:hypothetical protein
MPHEVLVDLFKNRPSLAAEILDEVLGIPLPDYTEARITAADLTQIQPAEYRADVVVLLLHEGTTVRVVIVEVQLTVDPQKRFTWPAYAMVSRAKHGCPVTLLVVAPNPAVARWCAEPIETGIPGFILHPPVLRYTAVPVVTKPEEAASRLELGLLSVMAHGKTEQGATIAEAVLSAFEGLDKDRADLYYDLVYNSLSEAARIALEKTMKGYQYQSEFAKRYVAEGRVEGRAEGEAQSVLKVLQARGLVVPDDVRERILAQKDPERLDRWLEKAAVASSVAEVVDETN